MKKFLRKIIGQAAPTVVTMVPTVDSGFSSLLSCLRAEGFRVSNGDYHIPPGTTLYTDGVRWTLSKDDTSGFQGDDTPFTETPTPNKLPFGNFRPTT